MIVEVELYGKRVNISLCEDATLVGWISFVRTILKHPSYLEQLLLLAVVGGVIPPSSGQGLYTLVVWLLYYFMRDVAGEK